MNESALLSQIVTKLETDAGASTSGNTNAPGYWKRIAAALEDIAGASTSASANELGYMLRSAIAAEAIGGTTGTDESISENGYLKRMTDGLEATAGVTAGSLLHRFYTAVLAGGAAATNLLTNGTFTTDTAGWVFYSGVGTFTSVGGKGRLTATGGFVQYYQIIATVIGQAYRITADIDNIDCSFFGLRKWDFDVSDVDDDLAAVEGTGLIGNFTATDTSTYIVLQANGGTCDFDNLSMVLVP